MRATLRLLASVKGTRYLEPFAPTGLTGLSTHPSPRPTLIYLYNTTLQKLRVLPETSVYRQATEALTQHRLKIVESVKPPGYEAWLSRVRTQIEKDPEKFKPLLRGDGTYAATQESGPPDPEKETWEGWDERIPLYAGIPQSEEELEPLREAIHKVNADEDLGAIRWEPEPSLESTQISEIENQIGAGLIEEVIQVAHGEIKLIDEMFTNKVWEELEEKPKPGQWTYFERGTSEPKS